VRPIGLAPLAIKHDAKIECFFRMKSTAKQEHNLNFNRNSYIPKTCVDPCPVESTTLPRQTIPLLYLKMVYNSQVFVQLYKPAT